MILGCKLGFFCESYVILVIILSIINMKGGDLSPFSPPSPPLRLLHSDLMFAVDDFIADVVVMPAMKADQNVA